MLANVLLVSKVGAGTGRNKVQGDIVQIAGRSGDLEINSNSRSFEGGFVVLQDTTPIVWDFGIGQKTKFLGQCPGSVVAERFGTLGTGAKDTLFGGAGHCNGFGGADSNSGCVGIVRGSTSDVWLELTSLSPTGFMLQMLSEPPRSKWFLLLEGRERSWDLFIVSASFGFWRGELARYLRLNSRFTIHDYPTGRTFHSELRAAVLVDPALGDPQQQGLLRRDRLKGPSLL